MHACMHVCVLCRLCVCAIMLVCACARVYVCAFLVCVQSPCMSYFGYERARWVCKAGTKECAVLHCIHLKYKPCVAPCAFSAAAHKGCARRQQPRHTTIIEAAYMM